MIYRKVCWHLLLLWKSHYFYSMIDQKSEAWFLYIKRGLLKRTYLTLARCQSSVSGGNCVVVLIGRSSVAAVVWHSEANAYLGKENLSNQQNGTHSQWNSYLIFHLWEFPSLLPCWLSSLIISRPVKPVTQQASHAQWKRNEQRGTPTESPWHPHTCKYMYTVIKQTYKQQLNKYLWSEHMFTHTCSLLEEFLFPQLTSKNNNLANIGQTLTSCSVTTSCRLSVTMRRTLTVMLLLPCPLTLTVPYNQETLTVLLHFKQALQFSCMYLCFFCSCNILLKFWGGCQMVVIRYLHNVYLM